MKSIIVFSSQTGFTKRYAQWLQEKIGGELITIKEAEKKNDSFFEQYDCIVYGGWAIAGKINKAKWFIDHIEQWKNKKLVLFCVGASPKENPDVDVFLDNALSNEQKKYAKIFYCPGGINYDAMSLPSKLAMKAFASMLKKKKDATQQEKDMAEWISKSYDISDKKYLDPIVSYLMEEQVK